MPAYGKGCGPKVKSWRSFGKEAAVGIQAGSRACPGRGWLTEKGASVLASWTCQAISGRIGGTEALRSPALEGYGGTGTRTHRKAPPQHLGRDQV